MNELGRIDHIAIAVDDLEASLAMYKSMFGVEAGDREYVAEFEVDVATFTMGGTDVELLEGKTESCAIRRFVRERGPGLHHIAFAVDDIRATLQQLKTRGVRLIDEEPRRGKANSLVAFLHPKSTHGVLYELVQTNTEG
jgi:methylmalonyl-CoA epimerase